MQYTQVDTKRPMMMVLASAAVWSAGPGWVSTRASCPVRWPVYPPRVRIRCHLFGCGRDTGKTSECREHRRAAEILGSVVGMDICEDMLVGVLFITDEHGTECSDVSRLLNAGHLVIAALNLHWGLQFTVRP